MKGYVFLANSSKPGIEQLNSRESVIPGNVSRPYLLAALHHGYEVVLGVNRNNPAELQSDLPIKMYDQHTYRSMTAIKDNLIAIRNLDLLLKKNNVEVIHCNTPVGGGSRQTLWQEK